MGNKSDYHEALGKIVKYYGAQDSMKYYGAQEQVRPGTQFQANLRKYVIHGHTSERKISNQKPEEGVIREMWKKLYREMFRAYCTRQLWS